MRRPVGVAVAIVGLLIAVIPAALAATESIYFYPDSDGYPNASLKTTSPTHSGPMHDIEGNGKQGRRIDKSDKGLSETDDKHYHQWSIPAGGLPVTGSATFVIWFADKDFKDGDTNRLVAYLLDCGSSGCIQLATTSKDLSPPDGDGLFEQTTLTFPSFDHTFASGRSLRLRLMIDKDFSDDDMTFAYDTTAYTSRLKMSKVVPATTTSTTTTSTTTMIAATTTTLKPTTTSSIGEPTTTTAEEATVTTELETDTGGDSTTTTSLVSTTSSTMVEFVTTTSTPAAGSGSPSTTLPPPTHLDTEKSDLVVRTTPTQRGVFVSAASVELSPVEGLMVTFVSAAETIRNNLLTSVGLGLIMASLLVIGMSRRTAGQPSD